MHSASQDLGPSWCWRSPRALHDHLDSKVGLAIHLCGPSPHVSEKEVAHELDQNGFDVVATTARQPIRCESTLREGLFRLFEEIVLSGFGTCREQGKAEVVARELLAS